MTLGRQTPEPEQAPKQALERTGQPEVEPMNAVICYDMGPYPGCSNGPYDCFVWCFASA
jgi:hypothetical protein